MATLTTQNITRTASTITPVAATAGGDAMECGPKMALEVTNGGGSPITVTLAIPVSASPYSNIAYAASTMSVPAGATRRFGSVDGMYRDPLTSLCTITYSAVTTVTVAATKLVD
jgi:hypothetical protein